MSQSNKFLIKLISGQATPGYIMEIARADVFFLTGWDSPCDQNSGL